MRNKNNAHVSRWITLLMIAGCLMYPQLSTAQLSDTPSFIKLQSNFIEYHDTAEFKKLIEGLKYSGEKGYRVAHFGDSHVQPDYSAAEIRKTMQSVGGVGGRGMTFPYSIAKTYSQHDYSSSFSGVWETSNSMHNPPRIALGVSGFVARTSDSQASFKMKFNKRMPEGAKVIKLVSSSSGYKITLSVDGIDLKGSKDNTNQHVLLFQTANTFDSLQVRISKEDSDAVFQLYGVVFEELNPGVVYHNLGVGGARFDAILQQKLFADQIQILNPDLFILDWGTNDILAGDMVSPSVKSNIHATIDLIRKQFPDAAILLTTVQDMNRKGKNIRSSRTFSRLIREIAFEKRCLLYDWFQVSGGGHSMKKWIAEKYAQTDNVHLTIKGYRLKGKLIGQAIINSLDSTTNATVLQPLWIQVQDTAATIDQNQPQESEPKKKPAGKKTYVVKKGDSLYIIARKHQTTVANIKKLNKLKSDKIIPGQRLIIRK